MKMKKCNNTINSLLTTVIIIGGGILIMLILISYDQGIMNKVYTNTPTYTNTAIVTCNTNSMGLGLSCDDIVYLKTVRDEDILKEGKIYTFKNPIKENETTVHRLVKDCTDGCFGYIFKGDNNKNADPVIQKEDILIEVIMVKYSV